ncbi:hypothetical protein AVEN_92172-1 [Araneus ventricosus]|uniref:Uncharacterized protein n=1 Tax=Araneus ventricosus TaxID=182803 RepID=A0A4Y2U389_ARAVE|nr:hypothetical protein AVEN_92172-1 [Araneus ventricosus]
MTITCHGPTPPEGGTFHQHSVSWVIQTTPLLLPPGKREPSYLSAAPHPRTRVCTYPASCHPRTFGAPDENLSIQAVVAVVRQLNRIPSPQLDQVQESARPQKSERFMVKKESAASVGTRPWTPKGSSLTLSIAFML